MDDASISGTRQAYSVLDGANAAAREHRVAVARGWRYDRAAVWRGPAVGAAGAFSDTEGREVRRMDLHVRTEPRVRSAPVPPRFTWRRTRLLAVTGVLLSAAVGASVARASGGEYTIRSLPAGSYKVQFLP